jgi:hypothetical protein
MKQKKTIGTSKGAFAIIQNGKIKVLQGKKIGSGKIPRKVFLMYRGHYHPEDPNPPKIRKPIKRRKQKTNYRPPTYKQPPYKKSKTHPLKFPDEATRITFLVWNRLGYPFIMHRPIASKVTTRGVQKLRKSIKRNGKNEVILAMERVHKLFNEGWFKWKYQMGKAKLSLPDFIFYNAEAHRKIRQTVKSCPKSWLDEGLAGEEYLKKKYTVIKADKNPKLSSKILKSWEEYNYPEGIKVNNQLKNQLTKIARLTRSWAKVNNFDALKVVDIIHMMLNESKSYKPKHLGYLANRIFWNDNLPKEVVRYGLVQNRSELKDIDL